MRRSHPFRRTAGAAVATALLLTACSGDGDEPEADDGASTVAAADDGERVLTVLMADDWATTAAVVDAAEQFEAEHPGVRVSIRGVPFGQLLEAQIADAEGPREVDLVQGHAFAAGAQGVALPITERFWSTFDEDYFIPGAVDDVEWADEIYGVPLDVNALVMVVNTTALEELGHTLEDLATWEGVREVAETAAPTGRRVTHIPNSTFTTYAWVRSNDADFFEIDDEGVPTFEFSSPEFVETWTFLTELTEDGRLAIPTELIDTSEEKVPLFVDGIALTMTTGSYDIDPLLDNPPDFEWDVVPMPRGPSAQQANTVLGGSSLYVAEQSDDAALAFEFAATVIEPEFSLAHAVDEGRMPPQSSVLEDPFFDRPEYRVVAEELQRADAMRLIAFPRVQELYTLRIAEMLNEDADPIATLEELQTAAEAAVVEDLAESGG